MPLLKANDFWNPNTYYYATERYKSLIENNNTLYICNESHLSQDEFDDSKFTSMGSGGGADLSERYAGEWDLNAGGSAYLVEAFPDHTKSTGYITISNDLFRFIGDDFLNILGPNLYDYVVANGASTVNSGIRSMKVNMPSSLGNNRIIFGVLNNYNTVTDLIEAWDGIPSNVSGTIFVLDYTLDGYPRISVLIVNNGVLDIPNISEFRIINAVMGEPLYFDLNTDTGAIRFSITGNPDRFELYDRNTYAYIPVEGNTITLAGILDLANFQTDTFAPYYGFIFESPSEIAQYTSSLTFDLGTTDDGRLPFLSPRQVIEPPVDAEDGKVYKVVGNGIYLLNPPIFSGDYVEFSENIQTLIVNRLAKTDAQLNNFILDVIDKQTQKSGLIDNVIKAKTSGSQLLTLSNGEIANIFPDTFYVEIVATDDSTLELPALYFQYTGKRLLIHSLVDGLLNITYWDGAISSVNVGDVFEFVAVKPEGSLAKWIRVK